jgi:DNA-binding MarR family transcriptional regulator
MPETDPVVSMLSEWTEIYMRGSMPNFIAAIRASGFSMSQIGALFHLRRQHLRGVSEIGDELGVSSAAASQMLDRLVQQGLVTRTEDPNDRRVKRLVITDDGKKLLKNGMHARQEWIQDLAVLLTPAEKEQVIAAMQILIAKANQLQQPTPEA